MSVPKGKRQKSPFEAFANLVDLRDEITKLLLNDFGFSADRYAEQMTRYALQHKNAEDVARVTENWQKKSESFQKWFIDEEARAILDIMRRIMEEVCMGNGIFPSETPAKLFEFIQRKAHMNKAIGLCFQLLQEMQYVMKTLPVDKNKYDRFGKMIEKEIALLKGVRQADNRLIKPDRNHKADSLEDSVTSVLTGVSGIISRVLKTQGNEDEQKQ